MSLFTLEHSKAAYRIDFGVFTAASAGLAALLIIGGPRTKWLEILALAALGLASWTLIEYGFHRFILHGLRPFSAWHAEHHRRPTALIYSPTILSVMLVVALIFVPGWSILGFWSACALTFGVVTGDLGYGITHHALHHWHDGNGWVRRRRHWHALHHAIPLGAAGRPGYYGVTTSFWDRVFGTCGG